MDFKETWQRIFPLKGEIVEKYGTWGEFEYLMDEPPMRGGSHPAKLYLIQNGRRVGVCTNFQHVHDAIRILELEFNTRPGLEEDYPHLIWSLLEHYKKDNESSPDFERSYKRLIFENASKLIAVLLQSVGATAEPESLSPGLWRVELNLHGNWYTKKNNFFDAYKRAQAEARRKMHTEISGTSNGTPSIEQT